MTERSLDLDWGDWALGDLSDVLRVAVGVGGGSQAVDEVAVWPPTAEVPVPRVELVVANELAATRLRAHLEASGYADSFCEASAATVWHAHLPGLVLWVRGNPGSVS
jgi:hypothetical protein